MKRTAQQGSWTFELKQVFCRKTSSHGESFRASAVITITDGVPYVELLINKSSDTFTKQDYIDFKSFIVEMGFDNAKFTRFKGVTKQEVEKLK